MIPLTYLYHVSARIPLYSLVITQLLALTEAFEHSLRACDTN